MAWTELKPSGKYQGRYWTPDGKVRSAGTFTQKKQAEREATRLESEQRKPGALDLDGGKIRWGVWFDQWLDSRTVAYSTDTNYQSTASNHILPYWGETRLDEIDQLGVNRWIKTLQRNGASPYTIRNAVTLFKTTLTAAADDNRIGRNPAAKARTPDLPQGVERYLSRDEVDSICFYMSGLNALIVRIGTETGLRFGELAGLHWSRVDLERGVLHVVEKYDQKANVIDPVPKDKERRVVPLTDKLVKLLRQHSERAERGGTCGLDHRAGRCSGPLVFRGPRGAALKSNAWGRGPWQTALDLARIDDRVRVHDMRHTYASWLIQQGVPLTEIARVMGHTDSEVTRRYAHLCDDGYDKVRDALTRASGAQQTQSEPAETASALRKLRSAERSANDGHTALYAVRDDDAENAS